MTAAHGLVIGKFYPPHAGHHLLVRTASRTCRRVSVVVMAASAETIPLADRVEWMLSVHAADANVHVTGIMDDHRVDYDDPVAWEAHVALMRQALSSVTDEAVDVVFTSEQYGDELARRFGARHVCVDIGRELVPASGTAVRRDPVGQWRHLAPPVRAALAKRVVLIGAESTGKSTLARELVQHAQSRGGAYTETRGVAEYGREYALEKWTVARSEACIRGVVPPSVEDLQWNTADFVSIAQTQKVREKLAAGEGGPILVCDTDAFATSVWHERYLGHRSADVESIAATRVASLYLLTHHDDVPFAQDGTRDGESVRAWMTECFQARLQEAALPFIWIRGDRTERREQALKEVNRLIEAGWALR